MILKSTNKFIHKLYYHSLIYLYRLLFNVKISKKILSTTKQSDAEVQKQLKVYRNSVYSAANFEKLVSYKKSDTLFVLGSGLSINELEAGEWKVINSFDSLGLNFFLAHPHVPTYYHIELGSTHFTYFKNLYLDKIEAYKNVPIIISLYEEETTIPHQYLDYIQTPFISFPNRFNRLSEKDLVEVLQWYYNIKKRERSFLFHYRSSLITAISLGVLLNYKRIVLTGIDLNSTAYFYDDPIYDSKHVQNLVTYRKTREKERYSAIETQLDTVHPTANKNWVKVNLTIDEIIKTYKNEILDRRNISLYVTNKSSLLYPVLDYLDLKNL